MTELADLIRLPKETWPDDEPVPELAYGIDLTDALRAGSSAQRIEAWQKVLATQKGGALWKLFAYHPGQAARAFRVRDERWRIMVEAEPQRFRWRTFVEIYEAWYALAVKNEVPILVERDAKLGAAFLVRTRWLLFSAPFRQDLAGKALVDSRIERARQTREEWLTVLDSIQEHPSLARHINVETEATDLTSVEISQASLNIGRSDDDPPRTGIVGNVVTRILLPRFAWFAALRVLHRMHGRCLLFGVCGALAFFLAAAATVLTAVFGIWTDGYTAAAVLGLFGYGFIAVWSAMVQPSFNAIWLLRQPASSAVGLLGLSALHPDWWATTSNGTARTTAAVLLAIGFGYLLIEAGNHIGPAPGRSAAPHVRRWALARRVGVVGVFGVCHAALVSIIGLRFVVPAFNEHAEGANNTTVSIACWWTPERCAPMLDPLDPWVMVLIATAWSFVSGVFLQILWDDQPITAPLAHVSWRKAV
ncbi:hypothetical protein AB0K12_15310 [Nonomuraea sp. NPDC049419]|uniref:hypothetical protein n=1 Tax=Nonomuraea sp. NPDC049419 TaxID=3155772 RepID=UPI00341268E9